VPFPPRWFERPDERLTAGNSSGAPIESEARVRSLVPALREPCNLVTVDLEEWFHVCGVGGALAPDNWEKLPSRLQPTTLALLDLLDGAGVRATFFVLGWVAARHPELLYIIRTAGHDIGFHGYSHQRVYDLDPEMFRQDLRDNVAALASAGVPAVAGYRAAEWSINERSLWALRILAEEGIVLDASMAPVRLVGDVRYPRRPHVRDTPSGLILELPPLVADRFAQVMPLGWGWGLRMSSPRRLLRAMDAANREGMPAVLAVHPWELDDDPPRVRLPPALHFAHYFRLSGFRERLREVLVNGTFGRIEDVAPGTTLKNRYI
jgi:peptidoglycan-N-acetylglucosamine deacetylase